MLATHKLNKLDWLRDQGAHDKPRRRKMAHAPAPKPCRANLCTRAYMAHKTSPEHRKMTQECQRSKLAKIAQRTSFKHTLLLLEGNPFQHYGNTTPSWLQTTPPSSLRIRHCNHMAQRWQCVRWRGWRRGWWCGWWCGWRSWWHRDRWLWQSCSRSFCGASPAHGAATEILLRLGPCCFPHRESGITIVRECAGGSRQQPTQEREQQQQAQQTATGDDAGEISFWSNCVEVTSTSNILVGGFLYVLSLTRSHV